MAVTFRKVIARPGVVLPKNPLGKRQVKIITDKYLKEVAKAGNKMVADGLLIPAPYGHTDDNGVYPIPLVYGPNGELLDAHSGERPRWDHAINAGFWTGFEIEPSTGELIGKLEVEGSVDDDTTHAGRVSKTFRQVSPAIGDWLDGEGSIRKDAPLHICLTNRGVQNAQKPFELLTPSTLAAGDQAALDAAIAKQGLSVAELAVAMSFDGDDYVGLKLMLGDASESNDLNKKKPTKPDSQTSASSSSSDSGSNSTQSDDNPDSASGADKDANGDQSEAYQIQPESIVQITSLFQEKFGIEFPEGTSPQNFCDRLLTVLTSIPPDEDDEELDNLTKQPEGSQTQTAPTLMSMDSTMNANEQAEFDALKKNNGSLLGILNGILQGNYKTRLALAQSQGKVGKKRTEKLNSQIAALSLSLDDLQEDGSFQTKIELDLQDIESEESLTATGLLNRQGAPQGSHTPGDADDMGDGAEKEPTKEEVNETLDAIFPRRNGAALAGSRY